VRKSGLIVGGAIVVVAAIGLLIGWVVMHRRKPVPVKTVAISTVFEGPEITLTGALQPQTIEQVDAPVAGVLDAWFVDVGGEVYEDQLVGRIRNADFDVELQNAQAAVDRAEMRIAQLDAEVLSSKLEVSRTDADQIRAHNELDRIDKLYQRYKNLFEVGALPRLTFEKTEADYNSAKTAAASRDAASKDAQDKAAKLDHDSEEAKSALADRTTALEKAKEAVAECDLHSPADGVVLTRGIHQGDKVEEKQNLMNVATELTKLAVLLTPDPRVLARIRAGQHAFVRVTDAELSGEVHEVRGTDVVVWFPAAQPVMKFGTAAQVRIVF
jgi:membrane fusion protein (multidrug efflux system)